MFRVIGISLHFQMAIDCDPFVESRKPLRNVFLRTMFPFAE
jgi:hypothetical protein